MKTVAVVAVVSLVLAGCVTRAERERREEQERKERVDRVVGQAHKHCQLVMQAEGHKYPTTEAKQAAYRLCGHAFIEKEIKAYYAEKREEEDRRDRRNAAISSALSDLSKSRGTSCRSYMIGNVMQTDCD